MDTVVTRLERRVRKKENILIPKYPSVEDIKNLLGVGKDYAYLVNESSVSFMDLYVRFGNVSFYANCKKEFSVT